MASAGGAEPERPHPKPFLIGVSGGTASGKVRAAPGARYRRGGDGGSVRRRRALIRCPQSTVCEKIMELLGQNEVERRQRKVLILSQDSFYKVLTAEQQGKALKGQYNFDHPGTIPSRPVPSHPIRSVPSDPVPPRAALRCERAIPAVLPGLTALCVGL